MTWGSFGCAGDIPGAGNNYIAWYNGNRAVHYGLTAAIQFPAGQAQRPLPPRHYVTYESTTCVITVEGNTYCGHGEFKLLMTPTRTLFKGWDDRRSYVCLSYGSCPRDEVRSFVLKPQRQPKTHFAAHWSVFSCRRPSPQPGRRCRFSD